MKRTRENKGITLIAIVITIIVLLILAGVTISTLTGDNGILGKASMAKDAPVTKPRHMDCQWLSPAAGVRKGSIPASPAANSRQNTARTKPPIARIRF